MSILSADGRTRCGERGRSEKSQETYGLVAGIACFTTWGLIPIYWKLLAAVPAAEILAHRFVWTTIFLSIVLSWQRRWSELIANARSRRARIYCLTGGLAIASNWFLFIYAVNIGRVIETSLGYFMTPLMNVLFGANFSPRTPHPVAVRIGFARRARRSESHFRLPPLPVDRGLALRHVWTLRITPKTIRHRRHSRLVYRNDPARSVCGGFSHLFSAIGRARVRPRGLVVVDLAHQHRNRHRRSAFLVRLRHPTSPPHHGRLPPISFSNWFVLSRSLPLSRAIHARTSRHFHFDLARACAFHRRSSPALAIDPRPRDRYLCTRSFCARLKEPRAVLSCAAAK